MNALAVTVPREASPRTQLPLLTVWVIGMFSVLFFLPLTHALVHPRDLDFIVPMLGVQSMLLAFAASVLAVKAHERLGPWEGRAAPEAALRRVRSRLGRDLALVGAVGTAGPVAWAAMMDTGLGEPQSLPGVVALLCGALYGGLVLSLGWLGRAPRVLVVPALLLLALVLRADGIRALIQADPLTSSIAPACAGLVGVWLQARRTLAARARPWPQFSPLTWLRRTWARRWQVVPYRIGANRYGKRPDQGVWQMAWLPLFFPAAFRNPMLDPGYAYDSVLLVAGYGLWLMFAGIFAGASLVSPPLHWRRRLAPGAPPVKRWARSLVLGSMLSYAGVFGAALALSLLIERDFPTSASAWASGIGDMLLATSFAAWQRGRRDNPRESVLIVVSLGLGGAGVLAVLNGLGLPPQRGSVWQGIQLVLTASFTWAAIRAWSRQDINALA